MNILFLFGHRLAIGGHFKSAQAFIKELVKKGHSVHVIVTGGNKHTIKPFTDAGASFSNIDSSSNRKKIVKSYVNLFLINKQIASIIFDYKIDVIHAQDSSSMIEGYKTACFYRKPFIVTQAGGKFVNIKPPNGISMVLYSKELLNGYQKLNKSKRLKIYLISERINNHLYRPETINKNDLSNFNLPQNGFSLFFAIRFHQQKESWINTLLYFAQIIDIKRITNFIIAGDGHLFNSIKEKAKIIEDKRPLIKFYFLGAIHSDVEFSRLINYSEICIGNGRTLMEAMACRKPTIILGEDKQFELIDDNNIELIREYNFSGRHFNLTQFKESYQKQKIETIIIENKLKRYNDFSFNYFEKNLSANIGAEKLIQVYSSSMINNKKNTNKISYMLWLLKRYLFCYK